MLLVTKLIAVCIETGSAVGYVFCAFLILLSVFTNCMLILLIVVLICHIFFFFL